MFIYDRKILGSTLRICLRYAMYNPVSFTAIKGTHRQGSKIKSVIYCSLISRSI